MITLFTAASVGCGKSSSKDNENKTGVEKAEEDLAEAQRDYLVQSKAFAAESYLKISANEKLIAELRLRAVIMDKTARLEYERKLEIIELQNKEMKDRADNYDESGEAKWNSFKREFNHDMDELGNAFKDLVEDNSK